MIAAQPKIFFFLLCFNIMASGNVSAQPEFARQNAQLNFKIYNVKDGLSQSSANCFLEDKLGFMWVGTIDGLNRFDGISFRKYKIEDGLSDNNIMDLVADSEGNIWISTTNGLNKYDLVSETFTSYRDSTAYNWFRNVNFRITGSNK